MPPNNIPVRPWYGDWPPVLNGGNPMGKEQTRRKKWEIFSWMIIALLIGVVMLVTTVLVTQYGTLPRMIFVDLSLAIMIAALLGMTLDRLFRQRIIEDVFKASIGYILPEALKGEMEWIYKTHILCSEHIQVCSLRPIDDERCVINIDIQRKLQNIGRDKETFNIGVAIDEWFHEDTTSQILSFGYIMEGKKWPAKEESFELIKEGCTIRAKEQSITLLPDEEVTVWYIVEEVRRTNDMCVWVFKCPTINPLVTTTAYEGISIRTWFGHREDAEQFAENKWRLNGTLLPNQGIIIRWWNKEFADKGIRTIGTQETQPL